MMLMIWTKKEKQSKRDGGCAVFAVTLFLNFYSFDVIDDDESIVIVVVYASLCTLVHCLNAYVRKRPQAFFLANRMEWNVK